MHQARGGFFFRNRRWLLSLLAIVVLLGVPSPVSQPTAERLARLLETFAGGPDLGFWRHVVHGLSAALVGLGTLWRTWGSSYLGASVVQDRQMHTSRLIADGPYRHTRNPLYLGNMLVVLGVGFLLAPLAFAVLVVGMWALVRLFIRDEEAGLEASGGDLYRAYRAAVPRTIPSWRARLPAAGAEPRWLQGFCGEGFLWALAILLAGRAITLSSGWLRSRGPWALAVAAPLYLWARRSSRKRAESGSA